MRHRAASAGLLAGLLAGCVPPPEIIAGPLVDTAGKEWHAPRRPGRIEAAPPEDAAAGDSAITDRLDAIDARLRRLRDELGRRP